MISEVDFKIYNTAKNRTKVSDNAKTDVQTIVSLEKEVRFYRDKIRHINEYYRMRIAELEKSEVVVNKITGIIDNTKQCYSNTVEKSNDDKVRAVALDKWKALDDIQKEIEWLKK